VEIGWWYKDCRQINGSSGVEGERLRRSNTNKKFARVPETYHDTQHKPCLSGYRPRFTAKKNECTEQ
jgi:hypothetical protein